MAEQNPNQVENAVAEGGAYEVIRKRLVEQGRLLNNQARALNDARLSEFGSSDLSVVSRVRVRTENNCVARDMVQIGDYLLFGYNVFIGLKKETHIEDVFSLFKLKNDDDDNYSLEPASYENSFLAAPSFQSDFLELYRYYKQTRLDYHHGNATVIASLCPVSPSLYCQNHERDSPYFSSFHDALAALRQNQSRIRDQSCLCS